MSRSSFPFTACLLFTLSALWAQAATVAATPKPTANRVVECDANGVLRWTDDHAEVCLFGVNYYPMFWDNYRDLKTLGVSFEDTIDRDLEHLSRMGIDTLRLHVFDRAISDSDGNVVENEPLRLLDYLIAHAKERGIYTVLTPIAWWQVPYASSGFSNRFTMQQMTTDPATRPVQNNYLVQFLNRRNVYTGLAYKDEPAIPVLELINEPHYPADTSDAQVAEYIDALASAVRSTGCAKPLFYNGWDNHLGAVRQARVQGSTFGWYPSGLLAGHGLRDNFLPRVDAHPTMTDAALGTKAKIVYEFDAADVPGGYLYAAMARSFRSGGAQIATQFQYDPLPLAPYNAGWQTHYMNLLYAPHRALGFMVAIEAFHRCPRGQSYGVYPDNTRFGDFRVNYEEALAEVAAEDEFIYCNDTATVPPAPEKLTRVAGCGSSAIVQYDGTGAYFLDKLSAGAWRLEVYPDAVWVDDPFSATGLDKEVSRLIYRTHTMTVRLPELGPGFVVTTLGARDRRRVHARASRFSVTPGAYVLQAAGLARTSPVSADTFAPLVLPEPLEKPVAVRHLAPREWLAGKPLPLQFTIASAQPPRSARVVGTAPGSGKALSMPLRQTGAYEYAATVPARWMGEGVFRYSLQLTKGGGESLPKLPAKSWELSIVKPDSPIVLFDPARDAVAPQGTSPFRVQRTVGDTPGSVAWQIAVEKFGPAPDALSFRNDVSPALEPRQPEFTGFDTLLVKARALEASTNAIELVVVERDGSPWGTTVPLTTEWRDVRIPLSALTYYKHWEHGGANRGGADDRVRIGEIQAVSVCFGSWLYPEHFAEPHTVEIESIAIVGTARK